MATTHQARELVEDVLRRQFIYNFMQPDQMATAPIKFPGIVYNCDGTLADGMKDVGTRHLLETIRSVGYNIHLDVEGMTPMEALHHILWDRWTKEELGNGRFVGELFSDYGTIYRGCTASDAARYTVERLTALRGWFYSVHEA